MKSGCCKRGGGGGEEERDEARDRQGKTEGEGRGGERADGRETDRQGHTDRQTETKTIVANFRLGRVILVAAALIVILSSL